MGPTLKLDITSPGQKSVEGTTTAVKQLAAALRDLPKASAELLKLQQALAGGGAAPSGLKAGAGEMKELVGELKNLGAQLNTSFLSLEETIKKGWAKAAKAQVEGEAKVKSAAGATKGMTVASVGAAGQPIEVPLGWFAKMQVGAAKYSEALRKADDIRAAGLEASKIKMQVTSASWAEKAREAEAKRQAGLEASKIKMQVTSASWAEAFRAAEAKRQAGLEASKIKMQVTSASWAEQAREAEAKRQAGLEASKIKMQVTSASWAEAFRAAEAKRQAGIEASRIKMQVTSAAWAETARQAAAKIAAAQQVLDARYAAMSPRAQARVVLSARSRLDQGVGADAVGAAFGGRALAAAQATDFAKAYGAVHQATDKAGAAAGAAAPKFKLFSTSVSDAHSAARGLASGFGAMYLTWGRLMPLLAGAALSNSFVQSIKIGADVRQDLETLRVLSVESTTAVGELEKQLISLGQAGPFGPREVAEAMKVLSLAGLGAQQVSATIKPALDLAIVGQTTIEKSASALVAVGTAYGYQAEQFGLVGDMMSKAAAISMSSVDGMMESFRSASVVGQQYKVSLQDTATALAILANVGIRNSAAGTSVRQMYSELSGASSNTRKAMKELGVEVINTSTGGMKPLLTIVRDLNEALSNKNAKGYQRAIQDMSNERGAKSLVALLEAFSAKAKEAGSTVPRELERIQQAIANAPGFAAISSAQLAATPQNQLKAVGSSFQTALFEAFKEIEPMLLVLSARMKEAFASPEFRSAVAGLASAVGNLSAFLVEHVRLLGLVAAAYAVWKGASIGLAAVNALVEAGTALYYRQAIAAAATSAAAATAAATARTAWLAALGPIGLAFGAVAAAVGIYNALTATSSAGAIDAARVRSDITNQSLEAEIERLEKVNKELDKGIGLRAAEAAAAAEADRQKALSGYREKAAVLEPKLAKANAEVDRVQKLWETGDATDAVLRGVKQSRDRLYSQLLAVYSESDREGNRIAENVGRVVTLSAINAAKAANQSVLFNPNGEGPPKGLEESKREAAEQAARDRQLRALQKQYTQEIALEDKRADIETEYRNMRYKQGYEDYAEHAGNLDALAEQSASNRLKALVDFYRKARTLVFSAKGDILPGTEQYAEFLENEDKKIFQQLEGKQRLALQRDLAPLEPGYITGKLPTGKLPDPIRVGGVWQQQLDDWKGVKEQLVKDRDEFMTGWVERGRTMWSDWLINGKLTFRSLGELFQQTLADITYKRFIAAPLAKAGESVFDSLLKPVSEARPGTGEASTDLRRAFEGLSTITKDVGNGLLGLGNDFWQLFVQVGNGLASMFASGGSSGIGSFVSSLFSASSGGGGEYIDVLGLNANGNAFRNGLYAFANGGLPSNSVISSPHFFRFGAGGSNLGVAGEAGEEAIMPLSRGPRGDLGVRVHGGSGGGQQVVAKTSVVIENHGGAEPKVSRETQPDGSELIRVVLNATAKDISRGGTVRKSMQSVSSKKNMPRY